MPLRGTAEPHMVRRRNAGPRRRAPFSTGRHAKSFFDLVSWADLLGSVNLCHAQLATLVANNLATIVNTVILGTVGYYSYTNWDKPSWDRGTISIVSIGLLTLWGGEG
jgi:hypothetical protein